MTLAQLPAESLMVEPPDDPDELAAWREETRQKVEAIRRNALGRKPNRRRYVTALKARGYSKTQALAWARVRPAQHTCSHGPSRGRRFRRVTRRTRARAPARPGDDPDEPERPLGRLLHTLAGLLQRRPLAPPLEASC